jgi:hypothetical protein
VVDRFENGATILDVLASLDVDQCAIETAVVDLLSDASDAQLAA